MRTGEAADKAAKVKLQQARRRRLLLVANTARDGYYQGQLTYREAQYHIKPYIEALKHDNLEVIKLFREVQIEDVKQQLTLKQYMPE